MVQLPSADNSINRGTAQRASNVQSIQNNDLSAVGQAVREVSEASARNVARASETMGAMGNKFYQQQVENQYYNSQIDASIELTDSINGYLKRDYDGQEQHKQTWAEEFSTESQKLIERFSKNVQSPQLRQRLVNDLRVQIADGKNKVTQTWVKKGRASESVNLANKVNGLATTLAASPTPLQEAITSTAFEAYGQNLLAQGVIDEAEFDKYRKQLSIDVIKLRLDAVGESNPAELKRLIEDPNNKGAIDLLTPAQRAGYLKAAEASSDAGKIYHGTVALMEEFGDDSLAALEAVQDRYANDPETAIKIEGMVLARYAARDRAAAREINNDAIELVDMIDGARDSEMPPEEALTKWKSIPANQKKWDRFSPDQRAALESRTQYAPTPDPILFQRIQTNLSSPARRMVGEAMMNEALRRGQLTGPQINALNTMLAAKTDPSQGYKPLLNEIKRLEQIEESIDDDERYGDFLARYETLRNDYAQKNNGAEPTDYERDKMLQEMFGEYEKKTFGGYKRREDSTYDAERIQFNELLGSAMRETEGHLARYGRSLDDNVRNQVADVLRNAIKEQDFFEEPPPSVDDWLQDTLTQKGGYPDRAVMDEVRAKRKQWEAEQATPNVQEIKRKSKELEKYVKHQLRQMYAYDMLPADVNTAHRNVSFVSRVLHPSLNKFELNDSGQLETHRLTHQTEPDPQLGAYLVYPMIHQIGGKEEENIKRFPETELGFKESLEYAKRHNNYIAFSSEAAALNYVKNYKTPAFEAEAMRQEQLLRGQ